MVETFDFGDLGLPGTFAKPFQVNSAQVVAEGVFQPVITSKPLAEDFAQLAGLPSQDFPISTRIFEFPVRPSDEVVVQAAENGLPLIVRRAAKVIVNFDIQATRRFHFADSKRPIYTYIPGFNIQLVPPWIRRPISNLVSSLSSRGTQDVVRQYSALPLTGFEAAVLLLTRVLAGDQGSAETAFQWPSRKRAVFVSLHDVDTCGFLRRKERDSLFRLEEKHQIKSTWFVPTKIVREKGMIDFLLQSGNEVGWHDYSHDHRLPFKPYAAQRARKLNHSVLAALDSFPLGMRTPKLLKSNHLFEILGEYAPLLRYDTSFLRGIVPYPLWVNGRESRILEIPTTVPTDIRLHNQLSGLSGPRKFQTILDAQIARTKKLIEVGGLISIVTHPEEHLTERPELLEVYDQYLAFVRSCPDLWFATAGELFNYWNGRGISSAQQLPSGRILN